MLAQGLCTSKIFSGNFLKPFKVCITLFSSTSLGSSEEWVASTSTITANERKYQWWGSLIVLLHAAAIILILWPLAREDGRIFYNKTWTTTTTILKTGDVARCSSPCFLPGSPACSVTFTFEDQSMDLHTTKTNPFAATSVQLLQPSSQSLGHCYS